MRIIIRQQPTSPLPSHDAVRVDAPRVTLRHRELRVLDFDCECRPMHFYGDYVSKEITAMAWAWEDTPDDVTCYLLGETALPAMLAAFTEAWDSADLVTGHFIRGFDIPLIQGALTEQKMPLLSPKLTHDTKIDAVSRHGLSSSQENWGGMLGLDNPKVQMDQTKWRKANRLRPEGLAIVRARVVGDVRQHIELRRKMIELEYLRPPVMWRSGLSKVPQYQP